MKRRELLSTGTLLSSLSLVSHLHATADQRVPPAKTTNRIGVSSYSFWGFNRQDLRPIALGIDHAARMGFDGFEILQRQLTETDNSALQKIKRQAFSLGLDLYGLFHASGISLAR